MGTFHDDKGELHGITVAVHAGDTAYAGRCDTMDDERIILLDCDLHAEGDGGRTNDEWLRRTAQVGVWKQHDRLDVPMDQVHSVTPLAELVRCPDTTAGGCPPVEPATLGEIAPPPIVSPDSLLWVTSAAGDEVRRLLAAEEPGRGLRLGVAKGGCSGMSYQVEFGARKDGDVVLSEDGFDVYVDPASAAFLEGSTLHFAGGLMGGGFQFENPNAKKACGCGESFGV